MSWRAHAYHMWPITVAGVAGVLSPEPREHLRVISVSVPRSARPGPLVQGMSFGTRWSSKVLSLRSPCRVTIGQKGCVQSRQVPNPPLNLRTPCPLSAPILDPAQRRQSGIPPPGRGKHVKRFQERHRLKFAAATAIVTAVASLLRHGSGGAAGWRLGVPGVSSFTVRRRSPRPDRQRS